MAEYTGELAGLGAALCWSIGSILFSQVRVSAAAINLFKNACGCLLLVATLLVLNGRCGLWPVTLDGQAWAWLSASALIGLAIGDVCYFRSMQILGPRRALVITVLSPPAGVLLGWFILDEAQGWLALAGIAVTIAGVLWVVRERGHQAESAGFYPGTLLAGCWYGALGALCQALGAVWSKIGIQQLAAHPDVQHPAMEASLVRLLFAVLVGAIFGAAIRRLGTWWRQLSAPGVLVRMIPASFTGTFLGIWLSLVAFQYTTIGIASTLTCMSPVFVLPLVMLFLSQRVSPRAILGALLACAGVLLIFAAR